MAIFGTVGIFVRSIPMPSATLAFCRAVLGVAFLLLLMVITGKKLDFAAIKKQFLLLCISGAAIGINWILLFESYRYTTVATATICYYLAPMFLLIASAFMGEKMTTKKLLCIIISLLGMVFVSGVLQGGISGYLGIVLSMCAAVLYASVVVMNRQLQNINAYDKTTVQLGMAGVVILPYILVADGLDVSAMEPIGWVLLVIVGIVHTGIAYSLYFGSVKDLSAQTVAVFSYLDPVISILLSALLLKERLDIHSVIGAALILGSALYSELPGKKHRTSQ